MSSSQWITISLVGLVILLTLIFSLITMYRKKENVTSEKLAYGVLEVQTTSSVHQ
jgi:hypothetical protein